MRQPIGKLLLSQGVITQEQVDAVLRRQAETHRPFGEIAEEMLGVRAKDIERAWTEQYAHTTRWVNPMTEMVDPGVREMVSRRQAWQFRLLPMGYDQAELMVCTTKDGLVRAMNFAARHVPMTCYFVLSELEPLAEALMRHYPMEGMSADALRGDGVASLARG
jgi:hypothetical protein